MNNEAVDIKGYDYLFDFRNNYQKKSMKAGNLEIQYTNQEAEIKVFNSGLEIYKGQLSEFIRQLYEKHQGGDYNEVDQKEMTFTIQDAAVDMKIIIYNAYGRMEDATDKITIDGIDFIIMAKVK